MAETEETPLSSLDLLHLSLITWHAILHFLDYAKAGDKLTCVLLQGMQCNSGLIPSPEAFQPLLGQNCGSSAHLFGMGTTVIPQLTKPANSER